MIWRSTALILIAFLVASLTVRFGPTLLSLNEFAFLGQLCLTILALSALDAVFKRLP